MISSYGWPPKICKLHLRVLSGLPISSVRGRGADSYAGGRALGGWAGGGKLGVKTWA